MDGFQLAGFYTVEWKGTDLHGQTVASGTYFYVLRANGERHAGKMVLMK